jgi:hypothetical protein
MRISENAEASMENINPVRCAAHRAHIPRVPYVKDSASKSWFIRFLMPQWYAHSVSAVLTGISRRSLLVLISIPMIIDNFNITCITIMPLKTNTPLFVNADSELPLPISF